MRAASRKIFGGGNWRCKSIAYGCCHVWMAPFMQGFFSTDVDRYGERSCVRPFDAVDVTAGLDEVRVPGP